MAEKGNVRKIEIGSGEQEPVDEPQPADVPPEPESAKAEAAGLKTDSTGQPAETPSDKPADSAEITEEEWQAEEAREEAAIEADLESALAEQERLRDQLLRARAEFDNYRKRTSRHYDELRKSAAESVLLDLLPVMDNLELALAHAGDDTSPLKEGVELVAKQFADVLQRHNVRPIPAVGERFNPEIHEAISRVPSEEHPEDTIVQEFQKGYLLGDKVLRASKVVVSSGPEGAS